MSRRALCALALALASMPAAAACGGEDRPQSRTLDLGGAPPARVDPAPHGDAAAGGDAAVARASLLTSGDLDENWRPTATRLPFACPSTSVWTSAEAHVASPYFRRVDLGVQQDVAVFSDRAAAAHALSVLGSRASRRCIFPALLRRIAREADAVMRSISLVRRDELGRTGVESRSVAYGVESVQAVRVYIDSLNRQVGRGITSITVVAPFTPIEEGLYARLDRVTRERLAQALGSSR